MGTIAEIFGYRVDDASDQAANDRRNALCPFMAGRCDGGGNRYASMVSLDGDPELAEHFDIPEDSVHAGVCSIATEGGEDPWIVCPRRLLVLGRQRPGDRTSQVGAEQAILRLAEFGEDEDVGVWPEVKLQVNVEVDEVVKRFDYTFDYVLYPLNRLNLDLAAECGVSRRELADAGWDIEDDDDGSEWILGPVGSPIIIEIMTSSTSGGNTRRGTTIPQAFRSSVIAGEGARGPGINYRQVWARMVSQLIVKSEAALAWGGKTIWVVQDRLADYISRTTALDLHQFENVELDEVNMLALPIDHGAAWEEALTGLKLYAGPVKPPGGSDEASFSDIVRAGVVPPKEALVGALLRRGPSAVVRRLDSNPAA